MLPFFRAIAWDTAIGEVQLNRYLSSDGAISPTPERYGRMLRESFVFRSKRLMFPFCESEYTIEGSEGAGTTSPPPPPAVTYQSAAPIPPRSAMNCPGLARPIIYTDRACCCPARPVVTVVIPAAPGHPRLVDLLLRGHTTGSAVPLCTLSPPMSTTRPAF